MARIEDVERRLLNWARWRAGGMSGGLGYASTRWGETPGSSQNHQSVIPTSSAEAMETDDAVRALAAELAEVVELHYAEGMSVVAIAVKRGCSTSTLYARLDRAHLQLDQAFREQAQARRDERERVERIARAARPGRGF